MKGIEYEFTIVIRSVEYGVTNDCDVIKRMTDELYRELLYNPGDELISITVKPINKKRTTYAKVTQGI